MIVNRKVACAVGSACFRQTEERRYYGKTSNQQHGVHRNQDRLK